MKRELFRINRRLSIFAILLVFIGCSEINEEANDSVKETIEESPFLLPQGSWLGKLNISDEKHIPFNLDVVEDSMFFINADERIGADIQKMGDEYVVKMPIFDSEFHFSQSEKGLFGFWENYAKGNDYKLAFSATQQTNNERFSFAQKKSPASFDGKWETVFSPRTDDSYNALGIFTQAVNQITGTFLTETGDYRYLQGNVSGDSLYLSCFDGSHAFLFEAEMVGDSVIGMFYSGSHWQEPWKAVFNPTYELQDPFSITKLVDGQYIDFTLPDLYGGELTYPSPHYTDKVVVIQLLGSWCPNCMDETNFLAGLYDNYHEKGLEIIGISFEIPEALEDKITRVKDLKEHSNANYQFVIGGDADKKVAEKVLPVLNKVVSFPTTIFIDKDGVIRKIHTGFYGPGTGSYYLDYVNHINDFVQKLLNE